MSVTPEQAEDALRQVERARSRSVEFHIYRISSPQLILWGVFWLIGYGGTDLAPDRAGYIWGGLMLAGLVLGIVLNRPADRAAPGAAARHNWRLLAVFATFTALIVGTEAIMQPRGAEMGAFVPLLVAATYVLLGLWIGWRYAAIGIAIAVLTMAGFFLLPAHFLLWMAGVGGGALILTGLWLRRA
jgi:hypothetical protein